MNESEIGQVFKEVLGGQLNRNEIFITGKLWNTAHAPSEVMTACKQSLRDLQLDYLDLYLMHWGVATPKELGSEPLDENGVLMQEKVSVRETWEAMQELLKAGLVKTIGVSNFTGAMLADLLSYARIKPAVNQIELHPYNCQQRFLEFCQYQNIAVTAYAPLGSPGNMRAKDGQPILLEDKQVNEIAKAHRKQPAQILIRWALERKTIVIPKSVRAENIKDNIDVFDFELSAEEMDLLSSLDRKHRYIDPWTWWRLPYFE